MASRNGTAKKRSEAGKKAWRTMRRNGTTPHRKHTEPINLRRGTDAQILIARLRRMGVCLCVLAQATGHSRGEVIRSTAR